MTLNYTSWEKLSCVFTELGLQIILHSDGKEFEKLRIFSAID